MIVSCPSCTTRLDIGTNMGRQPFGVSCHSCGHHWKEVPYTDVAEVPSTSLRVIDHAEQPDIDIGRLIEAAKSARLGFVAKRKARIRVMANWASLAIIALMPFLFAMLAPETTVLAAPITYKAYQKLGWPMNIYGLDVRHIEQKNQVIDGQHVLLITGEVSNATNDIRKIPWLRFALMDGEGKELYTWTLDTSSRPLRGGETTSFTTRISAPPLLANSLQIRFAHADEIRSNPGS